MITPSQLESRRDQILEEMREKGFEVDKDSYGEFVTLKLIRAEEGTSKAYLAGKLRKSVPPTFGSVRSEE